MKISKITKILPLALAFTMCSAFAADPAASATVNYSVTLEDYIKISTANSALTATSTFDDGYTGITITDMSGVFDVVSNAKTRTMQLTATKVNGEDPLYAVNFSNAQKKGTAKLVFAHTTEIPAASSISNITGGAPSVDSNPNAIAFDVEITHTYEHGPGTITAEWVKGSPVDYTMNNGVASLTYKVGGKNVANTFNTQDQSGTYKATLTLTDVGPVTSGGGTGS